MAETTSVTRYLDARGIPYRFFRHPGEVKSLEQAAAERGQRPDQVIRSILFRLAEDQYAMVLIAGAGQISWPALRKYLGQSRLTLARPEEVLSVTGYQTGSVSPFGLPGEMRILADESIFTPDEISIGSGERGTTVIIKRDDFLRALDHVERGLFGAAPS